MKIFWSWQSDTHQESARYFVREVLADLVTELNGVDDADEAERPADEDGFEEDGPVRIDHDTLDIGGSPPIAPTILGKIRECAVFVADVTPIAKTVGGKLTPNPNVMLELGYALHALDHERIVLVMNAAEGAKLSKLPFDLRHWRAPVVYTLRKGADDCSRSAVASELKDALKARIVPGLKIAEVAKRADRRRTHRSPEFMLKIDGDNGERHPITQTLREEPNIPTADDVRRQTPKLAMPAYDPSAALTIAARSGLRGLPGFKRTRPISEWTADEVAAHNRLIEDYYAEYDAYLQARRNWRLLLLRTFKVDLVLANVGTATATDIDVDIVFPEGIVLYDNDLPTEPKAPKSPEERPMTVGVGYARHMEEMVNLPRLTAHLARSTIVHPKERRVSFETGQLKHNLQAAFDSIILSFATASDIRSFDADYVVTANEPIEPIKGRLHFAIERTDASTHDGA